MRLEGPSVRIVAVPVVVAVAQPPRATATQPVLAKH
jgi:hypothetical protein